MRRINVFTLVPIALSGLVILSLVFAKSTDAVSNYDIIVYDDTTAGISSIKAISQTAKAKGQVYKVLWLRDSKNRKAMAENGVAIEDLFSGEKLESGNLRTFRANIDAYYNNSNRSVGTAPYIINGLRQSYEPAAAKWAFDQMLSSLPGANLTTVYEKPKAFSWDNSYSSGTVTTNTGSKYSARFFIDASVEADLARIMGANYRLGMNENVFNDKSLSGKRPIQFSDVQPCYVNGSNCGPEAIEIPLILRKFNQSVALSEGTYRVGSQEFYFKPKMFQSMYINPSTGKNYDYEYLKRQFQNGSCNIDHMVRTPIPRKAGTYDANYESSVLYELNQIWTDYRIPRGIFEWFKYPEKRDQIRAEIAQFELHALHYLQNECGQQNYYLHTISPNPYIRGEMRIAGQINLTATGEKADSIAIGNYNPYDRHLADMQSPASGTPNSYGIEVPYATMLPSKESIAYAPALGNLIVPTALSTDYKIYNTSVRMESTRMYLGEAAGTAAALAQYHKVKITNVKYNDVQTALRQRGVRIFIFNESARNSRVNQSPVALTSTPGYGKVFATGTRSVTVGITASDTSDQVQVAFRLVKNNNCSTAVTTDFTPWKNGGSHTKVFSNLSPGYYTWAAKVRDARYAYSIGKDYCGTDGWRPINTFTIQ